MFGIPAGIPSELCDGSQTKQHLAVLERPTGEWFAFWALFIIGVLSLVTTIVQITLSAAQLQVSLHLVPVTTWLLSCIHM